MPTEWTIPIPNLVTRTLICVDSLEHSDYSGTIVNPYMPRPVPFDHIKDVLTALDDFFNEICFPQQNFEHRTFLEQKDKAPDMQLTDLNRHITEEEFAALAGKVATFEILVRFRRSATWQGDFLWRERQMRSEFRSTLELLRLMDGALGGSGAYTAEDFCK